MTFDSMINEATNAQGNVQADVPKVNNVEVNMEPNNNSEEVLFVKVSYGDVLRRASLTRRSFAALVELVTQLFGIERASAVLKYQDEDGDKITMSTDAELQDAIELAKAEKKALRLFVESKLAPVRAEEQAPYDSPNCNRGPFGPGFVYRTHHGHGFGHRGGFPHPHPFGPRGGLSQFHHPHHFGPRGGFSQFPHPHHFGPEVFTHTSPMSEAPHGHDSHAQWHTSRNGAQHGAFHHHFGSPHMFAHGTFSPADATYVHPSRDASPYHAGKCAAKLAMRETIRTMKANASTPEEREAVHKLKKQMREECKAKFQAFHQNPDRLVAKHVADVTIPDNSELPADTPVTKTWRLQNAGTVAWPADCQLIFVSRRGDNLNGPERVQMQGPVLPGQEVDVSVTFITPSYPGRYIGYYRMATADGAKFGQRVWVSFVIPAPSAPAASASVPSGAEHADLPLSIVAGDVTMD